MLILNISMRLRLKRRHLGQLTIADTLGAMLDSLARKTLAQPKSPPSAPAGRSIDPSSVADAKLKLNGKEQALKTEPCVTLLAVLREQLDLTETKKGCDHGQCGACTVLINGWWMNSCLTFAIMHTGAEMTTIEGLANGDTLHPMQAAFVTHDAFQCGYCIPGQIFSAVGLMNEEQAKSDAASRESMSGNICRCGAYPNIANAVCHATGKRVRDLPITLDKLL